jgi:V-type H+-transporting ATPase 16kDa proteolipid subunit
MATFVLNTLLDVLLSGSGSGDTPDSAFFFGFMGAASALIFACLGSAYGTAKSGVGVANMGVTHPEMVMRSIIPVVMAGIIGIYGLIIAVIISTGSMYQRTS